LTSIIKTPDDQKPGELNHQNHCPGCFIISDSKGSNIMVLSDFIKLEHFSLSTIPLKGDILMSEIEKILNTLQSGRLEEPPLVSDVIEQDDVDLSISELIPKVKIIGVGGAGNNTITNLMKAGVSKYEYIDLIAVNTDARQLRITKAKKKIVIGRNICKGFGAGNDPEKGEAAAKESSEKLKKILENADLIFLTCGLGGGTGSGATPVIAEIARELRIPVLAMCTLPFSSEGEIKIRNAERALKKLVKVVNTIILIPNDKLLYIAPNKSIMEAFRLIDNILVQAVIGIAELIYEPGHINVDFADILKVVSVGGTALISTGKASSSEGNRAILAVKRALNNPLLSDIKVETAKSILINITSGSDITLKEAHTIVRSILDVTKVEERELKWGLTIKDDYKGEVKVTVFMTGIRIPYVDDDGKLLLRPYIERKLENDGVFKIIESIPRI